MSTRKKMESIVDRAVRQAIAEESRILHLANGGTHNFCHAPADWNEGKQTTPTKGALSTKCTADSINSTSDRDNDRRMPPEVSLEQSVKDVKQAIRNSSVQQMARADSMIHKLSKGGWRASLEHVVGHPMFDYFVATIILANALVIAYETETLSHDPHAETLPAFMGIDLFFTIFFALEVAMRIIVEKRRFIFGRNKGWNFFDTVVVLSAILEKLLSASTNMTAIRVLRIMRLVRVIRVIRTLRIFNDLRAMVKGIVTSILSLAWAVVLLFIICFVIGIFITQMVTTYRKDQALDHSVVDESLVQNFGSLMLTMYSLYKAITGGDDWSSFADPLFEISPTMGIFFCLYIAFAVFAVLNVVTGVFVDNAIKANHQDADNIIMEQTQARKNHMDSVKAVFKRADKDNSNTLDWQEFQEHCDNPIVQAYFRQLDLDIEANGAILMFEMLDFDGNGSIDIDEFIYGCQHLKGFARSLDLAKLDHDRRQTESQLLGFASEQHDRLDAMLGYVSSMQAQLMTMNSKFSGAWNKSPDIAAEAAAAVRSAVLEQQGAANLSESCNPKHTTIPLPAVASPMQQETEESDVTEIVLTADRDSSAATICNYGCRSAKGCAQTGALTPASPEAQFV